MVSTHLKNISQIGSFPRVGMKIKKFETTTQFNMEPENDGFPSSFFSSSRYPPSGSMLNLRGCNLNVGLHTLGCPPSQDASHHQDYYIFSRGSQPKPSFATVTGRGGNQNYTRILLNFVDVHPQNLTAPPLKKWLENDPFLLGFGLFSGAMLVTKGG